MSNPFPRPLELCGPLLFEVGAREGENVAILAEYDGDEPTDGLALDTSVIEARGEFIVLAVNAHDALVKALDEMLSMAGNVLTESQLDFPQCRTTIRNATSHARAALALARGEA